MDRIGADDPDIARSVEARYLREIFDQDEPPPIEAPAPSTRSSAWAIVRLALLLVFLFAVVAVTVKVCWVILQSLFGF